ncbi:MAG: PadR family transcriptional regulator [Dehalococcoidia bacterium]|nr:PadR family transcriptional regulator [Dehalococcoidia bacterium]
MFGRRHFERERHSRFFEKGDLKYVILDLLKDKPAHGYEIIRALEDRFYGFYSPSAGSVYPTLQLLEDMGYVKSSEQDGKRVYTITDSGKEFLKEKGETMDKIRAHMHEWCKGGSHQEMHEIMREMGHLGRSIMRKARRMDEEKLSRIREIINRAEREIEALS